MDTSTYSKTAYSEEIKNLADLVKEGKVVFFVGAGNLIRRLVSGLDGLLPKPSQEF